MNNELNTLLENMDMENLSPEELQLLQDEATDQFNKLDGVKFKEVSEDVKTNLENDFTVTRKVLTNNIDKVEKLTNMLMKQVTMQPENGLLLQNVISAIGEQNKQLKLLSELHNKTLVNKQQADKVKPEGEEKKSKLPAGMSFK